MTKKEEKKAAEEIKVDGSLYQYLTEEILDGFLPIIFDIGQLEGDYINQFEKRVDEKGITVNINYVNQLWKDKKPVPGVDLRSGEYGIEYAGAGFFNAGCQYFNKGDFDNALANLEKAIELCPRNILARCLKMQIHQKRRNFYLAVAEATNSILLNPVSIAEKDSASWAVLDNYSNGYTEELGEILAHAYYTRGSCLNMLGDIEGALSDFTETIRRMSALPVAVDARLGLYMELERWDEALADCDTLLAAGYEPANTHQYRGIVLRMMERPWEGIEEFTTAIALDPTLTVAYLQRAICNFDEGFYEAAINDASEAIKRNVNWAHYYRAKAYLYSGEYTKAIADFDLALLEGADSEEIEGWKKKANEEKDRGIIIHYHRQNESGEWEQVGKYDGKIVQIIPAPNFQDYLDECRREEMEEKRLTAK